MACLVQAKGDHIKTGNQICATVILTEPDICNPDEDFCFLYRYSFSHKCSYALPV